MSNSEKISAIQKEMLTANAHRGLLSLQRRYSGVTDSTDNGVLSVKVPNVGLFSYATDLCSLERLGSTVKVVEF